MILNGHKATFTRRTSSAYHHHKARARRDGQELLYCLDKLRSHVQHAHVCPYCQRLLTAATFTLDHALPTSRGGPWTLNNLTVSCRECNEQKGNLTADEFRSLLQLVWTWAPVAQVQTLARLRAGSQRLGKIIAAKRKA